MEDTGGHNPRRSRTVSPGVAQSGHPCHLADLARRPRAPRHQGEGQPHRPGKFHRRWVNDKFRPIVGTVVRCSGPTPPGPRRPSTPVFSRPRRSRRGRRGRGRGRAPAHSLPSPHRTPTHLVHKYSFENFVVGPPAASPPRTRHPEHGGQYNPLFIYAAPASARPICRRPSCHVLELLQLAVCYDLRPLQRLHRWHPPQADG
jgi:hypothetical protein